MPWPANQGAGQLTEPGPSRLLPPTEDQPTRAVSQTVATRDEAPAANPQAGRSAAGPQAGDQDWWKEDASRTLGDPQSGFRGKGISPRGEIIVSTQILAMVGSEPILAGDLLGRINEALKEYEAQLPEDELDKQRWLLMERMLPSAIEAKLVFLDFTRRLEKEQIKMIRSNVYQQFDEKQLPALVENAKLRTAAELDSRLRSYGSSLENVRRGFFEQVAAREMIRKHGEDESEITHDELLAYYQEHQQEYEFGAKARWEQLMVKFDRFPSKREAYKAIAEMGNAVLRGAPFDVVARRSSQCPRAAEGGVYDWTNQGSLASTVVDKAIFSLPVGRMSDILQDEQGFHIVRVIERREAGRIPFLEAQVGIREKIKEARRDNQVKDYLDRLKRETYVWNHFADEAQVAERQRELR